MHSDESEADYSISGAPRQFLSLALFAVAALLIALPLLMLLATGWGGHPPTGMFIYLGVLLAAPIMAVAGMLSKRRPKWWLIGPVAVIVAMLAPLLADHWLSGTG